MAAFDETPVYVGDDNSGETLSQNHVRSFRVQRAVFASRPAAGNTGVTFISTNGPAGAGGGEWLYWDDGTVWQSIGRTCEAFPIGSVFLAVVSTDPNTLLGYGTWSQIAGGRVLIGQTGADVDFDTAEETGGAKTHTHTAHAALATHSHAAPIHKGTTGNTLNIGNPFGNSGTTGVAENEATRDAVDGTARALALTEAISGGTPDAHNTPNSMNPYLVVYVWKRTA